MRRRDEQHIGLQHGVIGEQHIRRGGQDDAAVLLLEPVQTRGQDGDDTLVAGAR
ncbi:MAG TPA: hypothetical protein VM307_14965 [Egibacteraceae bacterium]|nr:hypothetical protein [Egibacteraceae bacterium]